MYAFLRGELVASGPPVVLLVGGVGFELAMPERSRLRLPAVGESVQLFTHHLVREDEEALFGFFSESERSIFRTLIGVSGIGPKVALTILGDAQVDQILAAAAAGDALPLTKVKGIGRKTADRLVVELRDRALPWLTTGLPARAKLAAAAGDFTDDDATLALIGLGLTLERAREVLSQLPREFCAERPVQEVVRAALRHVRS